MPHTWHDARTERDFGRQIRISIHMPHTWHDKNVRLNDDNVIISIHMPHTWHDCIDVHGRARANHFNPHATYVA